VVAVLGAYLAALVLATGAYADTGPADAELQQDMQAIVAADGGPPGISAVVQRGMRRRLLTAGSAARGASDPIRINDHMRIASVTKAFTGAVVLRLVRRDKLKLGDTVAKVRPDLPPAWGAITVRQLLYHTSGLPNYTESKGFQAYFPTHLKDYLSPEQILDFVRNEPLNFPPGSDYRYSNTDNIVLGLMAESAASQPFSLLLQRLVLRPLGLTETSFPSGLEIPEPFVRGYIYDGPGAPLVDVSEELSPSGTWAAGAIISTPADLNSFIRAWGAGRFLGPRLRRAQTRFIEGAPGQPAGPGDNSGGLALYRYETRCGTVFGHTGNFPGYTQFIASSPDGSRSTVVSANEQIERETGAPGLFEPLRGIYADAACAALAR
jgi:D-alanyl-D-alanine carboxypeptidase